MFKIESYVTQILLSYIDKHVRDFKPANAQVSLWGGGVALYNLVLKADVLQQEVSLPFTLVSGRIHELLIQVPWTKLMSEPIVVTIDTIECVLCLHPSTALDEMLPESPRCRAQRVEAPPGYMQALVRRVVSNIALRVHHLIVKYVQDDVVLSMNVKHLSVEGAGADWQPAFADIDQAEPLIRRLVQLEDLTLCLDRADSDGKISFYQEPLLYRCQLDLRVLTLLGSANTRRATSLSVQVRSSKLAWGVTSEQMKLLLRLLRERQHIQTASPPPPPPPPPPPNHSATNVTTPSNATLVNSAEPVRQESWSEWAWSWLPTWIDKEGGVEEATLPTTPIPICFTAYLDYVSLVFKVMESDGGSSKRARGVLELSAEHALARAHYCMPTSLRVHASARELRLFSRGKCVCGDTHLNAASNETTIYMERRNAPVESEPWCWPADILEDKVDGAEVAEEEYSEPPNRGELPRKSNAAEQSLTLEGTQENEASSKDDDLWHKMSPILSLDFTHTRTPPNTIANPHDNPPVDFEFSDWGEDKSLKINVKPLGILLCAGLVHRLTAFTISFNYLSPSPASDIPMKTLTVEECEALYENLPQRRFTVNIEGLRIRMHPWDHGLKEKQTLAPLVLDIEVPQAGIIVSGPLYSHRVCSAACQMPHDEGPLWQGSRLHVSATLALVEARLSSPVGALPRPVARADMCLVMHVLLHPELFVRRDTLHTSYSLKINEVNTYGSAARLQAAWQVAHSLATQRLPNLLCYTALARDALADEESVAIDLTLEDFCVRGFVTRHTHTHIAVLQSARVMAFHAPGEGKLKRAWLFSAPDKQISTSLLRVAVQLCSEHFEDSLDYVGIWSEPVAFCIDPLFIAWLAYQPQTNTTTESSIEQKSSSQMPLRCRSTPPNKEAESVLLPEWLLQLYERLTRMLVSVELGLAVVYVPTSTASTVDCATLRDAMERHAAVAHDVLAISMGRLTVSSSVIMNRLWEDIRNDGPTFKNKRTEEENLESFPWKLNLADVSCYTMEARQIIDSGHERASGLRSQLKASTEALTIRTILESVTTTATVSVVTKSMIIRSWARPHEKHKVGGPTADEKRVKYFTAGVNFKPSTFKEFFRGPARRKKENLETQPDTKPTEPTETTTKGPVMSIGVQLHADTPHITVRLEQAQVHTLAAAVHCLKHLQILMQRAPESYSCRGYSTLSVFRSFIRSSSENEEQRTLSDENSESRSELVPIFESHAIPEVKLKKFLWFQWMVGRANLVIASKQVKLAVDASDIISTIDFQDHYNQLKVKVASVSVRHHKKNSNDEWAAGCLGGRVLEARESANAKEENNFLAVTITQAQISNLPTSWKEELNPKLLEQKPSIDSMWEIYVTLAPLEALLQPVVLENILSLAQKMAPPSFCPLQSKDEESISIFQWPFCYVTAGGLRLLVTTDHPDNSIDDTFLLIIGKITVSPYPENPICRRPVNAGVESGGLDGRQYDIFIKNVALQSAQFYQIMQQEANEIYNLISAGRENPPVKWTQPPVSQIVTPILHSVDISCVLAPAVYLGEALVYGPALQLNLASDCVLELSVEQLQLVQLVAADAEAAIISSYESNIFLDKINGICPYASLVTKQKAKPVDDMYPSTTNLNEEESTFPLRYGQSYGADSSVDVTIFKSSQFIPKKIVSIAFADGEADAMEYVEVFVTMEIIELSLYIGDDGSPKLITLRPPSGYVTVPAKDTQAERTPTGENKFQDPVENTNKSFTTRSRSRSRSVTETVRDVDMGRTKLELQKFLPQARKCEGKLPLLHITLHQLNLYYWKKRVQSILQVSLFNAWMGLGVGQEEGFWSEAILSTAKGVPDPVTDIPPALATMKIVVPSSANSSFMATGTSSNKGIVTVDIERPLLLEISTDKIRRLQLISELIQSKVKSKLTLNEHLDSDEMIKLSTPLLYKLRKLMVERSMESITIQASQLGMSGSEGTVGWDSASLQIAGTARPERVVARALVTALLVAAGPPSDSRHVVLQPLMLGVEFESSWEAWRKADGGAAALEPLMRVGVHLDRLTVDVRPADFVALCDIHQHINTLFGPKEWSSARGAPTHGSGSVAASRSGSAAPRATRTESSPDTSAVLDDRYYNDDLKSGAFKIESGNQLPKTHQVILHGNTVSWRYPHPRTITRMMVLPIPGLDEEVNCVLEFYNFSSARWESHTFFKLPLLESRELRFHVNPPDTVFAILWRFRAYADTEVEQVPFQFNLQRFMPRTDPLALDEGPEPVKAREGGVSAQQLLSALCVDSYFALRLTPRASLALRFTELELHVHNSLLDLSSQTTVLEGYYVSRPLMRSHRVLSVIVTDSAVHALLGSSAGSLLLLDAKLSCDILECATGTMEQTMGATRMRAALSAPARQAPRARAHCAAVRVALHVPHLRTLRALARDWQPALTQSAAADAAASVLDGRVSLWIHNSCASALRVGQESTDELIPLAPGARLAYRWRSPDAPLQLRFALAGPAANWHWSKCIPFTSGVHRVRLEDAESVGGARRASGGVSVHVRVEAAPRRTLRLAGRLLLANALRRPLLYEVRARCVDTKTWRSAWSGELDAESVGHSVLCGAGCEMVLKIKFTSQDTGWSGDIPLKECPKENVPWLVKVPSSDETAYVCVWCRVVRARSDGRVLAAVWPLYVLYSHLPLDTDVLVTTETELSCAKLAAPLIQTAPGRGSCTHVRAPGTTAARHQLSLQYRDIECPVTREAIPLHYGVTDTSVFDKRAPVNNIENVVEDIRAWFERSGREATSYWPYSVVTNHWYEDWRPAQSQPRCDVSVRYSAVRAGGGCSLELQLCPVALICNAAPLSLTLRAHDAAPLCQLEPGAAISAPSVVLTKPFFMSMELGRETFVSSQLQVWAKEPGRYGEPPCGAVMLDRAAAFAIQCNHKVALLTLNYEIKEDINILGVTSSFVLINRLNSNLLVSAISVPIERTIDAVLRPKTFKVVKPTKKGSLEGVPLSWFSIEGRWRGGEASELHSFVCLTLPGPAGTMTAHAPAPVRLGTAPMRRAIHLFTEHKTSLPVVVVQQKHQGRWLVTVGLDPCPQFVVHNRTCLTLALAEPVYTEDKQDAPLPTKVVCECAGASWWHIVEAGGVAHYSTPSHCARFPPPLYAPPRSSIPFLAIGIATSVDEEPEWSPCVAAAGGEQLEQLEQLVQLPGGATVQLRVRPHPHSTLLELQHVDQVLSDIEPTLERVNAIDTLITSSEDSKKTGANVKLVTEPTSERVPEPSKSDVECAKASKGALPEHQSSTSNHSIAAGSQQLPSPSDAGRSYSASTLTGADLGSPVPSSSGHIHVGDQDWSDNDSWLSAERLSCVISSITIEMAITANVSPLFALHIDRAAILLQCDNMGTKAVLSIADVQVDNLQYDSGQYEFGVVASTCAAPLVHAECPPLWSAFVARDAFAARAADARLLLRLRYDKWRVVADNFHELTEVELSMGPLALYVEDSYVAALAALARAAHLPPCAAPDAAAPIAAEARALQRPLRLRLLHLHPLHLTLTLHTAMRVYIALDQSPLRLSAFQLRDVMSSAELLTRALTVHYLSAAVLGAGWVVGGLEMLGAPGALVARVGGATGGVRGVAAASAAALLRSLSAWLGSLARNLDLLAGDDAHARRLPPDTLMAGLAAGFTNLAINTLGAMGGVRHFPLEGAAVGETSGAAALRRGLLGTLTKPLSATADLLAFAGTGLLRQTGWDPVPQPRARAVAGSLEARTEASWRRDCVRWTFWLAGLSALAGFDVLLDGAPRRLLLTHKFLVVADSESERIVEMIDLRFCTLGPYQGSIVELMVNQRRQKEKVAGARAVDEHDEYQLSAAAMSHVARPTGAGAGASEAAPAPGEPHALVVVMPPRHAPALHAALAAALHHNADSHLHLL